MKNNIEDIGLLDIDNLKNINIANIFFDHPLSEEEIINLRDNLFHINNISQVYFKDDIDIRSIEIIKYLLEIIPNINDSFIEKIILNTDKLDKDTLLNMNYENPDTWQIAYKKDGDSYEITTIARYRNMESIFTTIANEINSKDLSIIEKVALAYNKAKLLNYTNSSQSLIDIVENKCADSYGFNLYFSEMLKRLNIPSYIGNICEEGINEFITMVDIKDDKYDIDGFYLFNPCNDSISKDEVKNEKFRGINYNYFAIRLSDYNQNQYGDKLANVLSCFIHDIKYDIEKFNLLVFNNKQKVFEIFNSDFFTIHKRVHNTKKIDSDKKLKIIDFITTNDNVDYKNMDIKKIIKENFIKRQNIIFNECEKDIVLS